MLINKITCGQCFGTGRETVWRADPDDPIIRREEINCVQCTGKGYIRYPVFKVEEAIEIAKYFGFAIEGLEDEDNDKFCLPTINVS